MGKSKVGRNLESWIYARQRYRLSYAQVEMARELRMNPKKFGAIANHHQEPWKMPLPEFIEHPYRKRFGRAHPEVVLSLEKRVQRQKEKKAAQRREKKRRVAASDTGSQ